METTARHMAKKARNGNPVAVSDVATAILDPMLRRRAGISVGLVQSWDEIVGPRLARSTRPEKIIWPRRLHEDDPFEPAVLVIACEGAAALHLQHETGEIIGRVNAFLGFSAIGRIRIVQKPVTPEARARSAQRRVAESSSDDCLSSQTAAPRPCAESAASKAHSASASVRTATSTRPAGSKPSAASPGA